MNALPAFDFSRGRSVRRVYYVLHHNGRPLVLDGKLEERDDEDEARGRALRLAVELGSSLECFDVKPVVR